MNLEKALAFLVFTFGMLIGALSVFIVALATFYVGDQKVERMSPDIAKRKWNWDYIHIVE